MAKDYELLVLFTSSPGFHVDVKIAEMMKDSNPKMKVAFVGPPVTIEPDKVLNASKAIDFIVRREFDYQIANYAKGTPLEDLPGVSYRKNGENVHNPEGGVHRESGRAAVGFEGLQARSGFHEVQRSVPAESRTFRSTRRADARRCARSACGRRRIRAIAGDCGRATDIANECRYALENFPGLKEIFFDDDTFNYRKARTLELCAELKKTQLHLVLHVARHHRLRNAEGDERSRMPAADRRL